MQHAMLSSILGWTAITDFGDSALALPLAAIVLVALLAAGWSRGAIAWSLAVAGCGAAIVVFKLAFKTAAVAGCAPDLQVAPAFSPSGHTALSTVVYGGLVVLTGRQMSPLARSLIGAGAVLWIGLIASSRVAMQAHTPIEVIAGLLVGVGAIVSMACMLRQTTGPRALIPLLAAATGCALLLMYGAHWEIESGLRAIAELLHRSVACVH
jgi:membrane-associated phospholipid phosphatase